MPRRDNKHDLPESYEHWDLALPALSRRSALYQIRPIGIGTADTECLTSYLARLADAHHLAVGDLILRYFLPLMRDERAGTDRPLNSFRLFKMVSANGADALAADLIALAERLTLTIGISPTTFVLWNDVVSRLDLLRHYRAWCAECYSEQAATGGLSYDLLLWTVIPVKICPRHRRPLTENCPNCNKRVWPVLKPYLPGSCPYCGAWFGAQNPDAATRVIDDLDYELWVADNIGAVIAASPLLPVAPARQHVINSINHCCNQLMEGNSSMLARWLKTASTTPRNWLAGRAIPPLKVLARLSYLIKAPLIKILTESDYVLEHISKHPIEINPLQHAEGIRHLHRRNRLGCQKVRESMEAALVETPPPSLAEVARRLGYRHRTTLNVKFPELSSKISANYSSSERCLNNRQSKRLAAGLRPTLDNQRKILEQELDRPCPSSLKDLGLRLGYAGGCILKKRFPDLCVLLMEKRRQYRQQQIADRLSDCRQLLEAAMKEDPPPNFTSVARRLAVVEDWFLREHFAQECLVISARYTDYRKKRMQEAGDRLRRSLQQDPPQSLNRLSKELGYHFSTLARNYPEICRSVMDRYDKYARKLVAERKQAKLINSIVCPLEA